MVERKENGTRPDNNNRDNNNRGRQGRDSRPRRIEEKDDLIRKLICINRVTKVVKGGRNMRFAAMMVVGDGAGNVGIGMGKANEVPVAIEKAVAAAKKNMRKISLVNNTIPHEVVGKFGRGSVMMLPAEEGTGVIAGGPVRSVLEAVGIKDIRTKSRGTSNPVNCVKATLEGLSTLRTVEEVAAMRGKKPSDILG
ncbi:MAG: 30S ribosomal protein S5 [Clostridia bacterium]